MGQRYKYSFFKYYLSFDSYLLTEIEKLDALHRPRNGIATRTQTHSNTTELNANCINILDQKWKFMCPMLSICETKTDLKHTTQYIQYFDSKCLHLTSIRQKYSQNKIASELYAIQTGCRGKCSSFLSMVALVSPPIHLYILLSGSRAQRMLAEVFRSVEVQ